MEPINKQTQNIQVSNEQIPNNKPKKTWVEPELVSMGVESGEEIKNYESHWAMMLMQDSSY